jgi:hypothetical protein
MENTITQDNIKNEPISAEEAFSSVPAVSTAPAGVVPPPADFSGLIQEQEKTVKQGESVRDNQLQGISSAFARIAGLPQQQLAMEQQAGIQDMESQLQQFDSMIAMKNRDYTNQFRALEERGSSLSSIRGRQNQLNIQATREMADLAIIRDSKAGRLDLAKQWVQKKVDAETAQARLELEATQFFYNENKEILTKAQDRAFSLKIADQERKLAEERETRNAINNMQLQAAQYGASPDVVSQIGNAKTQKEAIAMASKYLGEPFRLQVDQQAFNQRMAMMNYNLARSAQEFARQQAGIASEAESMAKQEEMEAKRLTAEDTINVIIGIKENQAGIGRVVGATPIGRGKTGVIGQAIRKAQGKDADPLGTLFGGITGNATTFKAQVGQIVNKQFINTLTDAKLQGATFGALNKEEGDALKSAGTALIDMAKLDKDGKIQSINVSEEAFIAELNKIQTVIERAYLRNGGVPKKGMLTYEQFVPELNIDNAGNVVLDIEESNDSIWSRASTVNQLR